MPELIIYLIKANIALCLFYLAYRLGLRRLTFYFLNRFFLLSGIVFSSLFPLVDVNDFFNRNEKLAQQVITYVPDLNAWQAVKPEVFSVWALMEWAFWAGVAVMFLRLVMQLVSLLFLHRKTAPGTVMERNVRLMGKAMNPFSFFRNIYVNPALHSEEELQAILEHEAVHVKEWHSADVLMGELNNVFYWFNPGAWLMKTAIRENLEFLTDRTILRSGMDPKAYQYSLIQVNTSKYAVGIANNFNFSHLKNRIQMMNKRRSSHLHIYRYAVLACIVCGALLSLNFTKPGTVVHTVVDEMKSALAIEKKDTVPAEKKEVTVVRIVKDAAEKRVRTRVIENRANGGSDTFSMTSSGVTVVTGYGTADTTGKAARHGLTGAASGIRIRGTNMHNADSSHQPLIIVNGEVQENGLEGLNPETIASISVLKDKPATSLYGPRGNFGVILVTTKVKSKTGTAGNADPLEEVTVIGRATPRVVTLSTTTVTADSARTVSLTTSRSNVKTTGAAETVPSAVFPNPTNGLVNVSFYVPKGGNSYMEVLNMEGKPVYYKSLKDFSGTYNGKIDLRSRPAGTYILTVSLPGNSRFTSRIVKQ